MPFEENPRLVRGLDYYTRTAFEVLSSDLGAQSALLGGGRYDGLVRQLGGPDVPAFGWAIGLDRLAILLQQLRGDAPGTGQAVLVPLGEGRGPARPLPGPGVVGPGGLPPAGIPGREPQEGPHQRPTAWGRPGPSSWGDGELEQGVVAVKDLTAGTQETWAPWGKWPVRLLQS